MFTGKPLPPMRALSDVAGWIEGAVRWCDQSALRFGADRGIPVPARPVVTLRRDGSRAVVLPCTSQDRSRNPLFRELVSPRDVMWVAKVPRQRTFAFRRYETVGPEVPGRKFGDMNDGALVDLLRWVKEHY